MYKKHRLTTLQVYDIPSGNVEDWENEKNTGDFNFIYKVLFLLKKRKQK